VTAGPAARHNAAIALRKAGRLEEALAEYDGLIAGGLTAPETLTMRAHLLGDLGRYDAAVAQYREVIEAKPDMIDAHETLAKLLPQIGRSVEALDGYRAALAVAPDRGMLWVSALGMAKALGNHDQLLEWCDAVEARFGPDTLVTTLRAQAWSATGRDAEALDLIDRALAADPRHGPLHNTRAHVAIRLGEAELAKQAAMAAAQLSPEDQTAWALLSVALRLQGDPRETWLADYERHVRTIDLDGLDLRAVAACLTALHTTQHHPAEQSLRGGTQTRGNLFDRIEPEVIALRASIERAIAATLAELGHDPKHPFLRRNAGRFAFAGSWSVRLRSEGFHISHIHPAGWLSSACYISLPREVGHGDAGALAFGVPDGELGLDLPPRRVVHPREGQLVLFPSYMWHGTLPFESEAARLTVAFDAVAA